MKYARLLLPLSILLMTANPVFAAGSCAADLNGDGYVSVADVTVILGVFGSSDARADLNGNGYVGEADLNTVLDNLGPCNTCPPDLNADSQVDEVDRQLLEQVYGTNCRANLGRFGDVGKYDFEIFLVSFGMTDPDADIRADINGDGYVNSSDLTLFQGLYGTDCRYDLNSDGEVNTDDLWVLLGCWGTCP